MNSLPLEKIANGGGVECGLHTERPAEGPALLRLVEALDAGMQPRTPARKHGRLIDDHDWILGYDPQK